MLAYSLGFVVGLLAIAPPLNYHIPVVVNSYAWLYGFLVASLFSFFLLFTDFPAQLRIFLVYLFVGCFISLCPYVSFNAFILVVGASYCFIGFTKCDFSIVADFVAAVFFLQIGLVTFQLFGFDRLMNFDKIGQPVFFGTVFQYMRFSSLLAIMAPILVWKNKLFIFPLVIAAIISQSSGFALAIIAGIAVYFFLTTHFKWQIILVGLILVGVYCVYDWDSVSASIRFGRLPRWWDVILTWCMDTSHKFVLPLSGPVDWKSIFFGRGLDTFLPLFPLFKHDLNPFAQAHNCHLQLVWEIGIIGYTVLATYFVNLVRRVWSRPILVGGLACMAVNMFFSFPTRMTQTMLMMIAFLALCEQIARKIDNEGEHHAC